MCIQRLREFLKGLKRCLLEFVREECEGDATLPHGVEVDSHPTRHHYPPSASRAPHLKCYDEQASPSVVGKIVEGAQQKYILKLQCNKAR